MAYVPLVEHPKGVVPKLAARYGKRRFGRDVEPPSGRHLIIPGSCSPPACWKPRRNEGGASWTLIWMMLAVQASAGVIGCPRCTDYGYYEGLQRGVDPGQGARRAPLA